MTEIPYYSWLLVNNWLFYLYYHIYEYNYIWNCHCKDYRFYYNSFVYGRFATYTKKTK